MTIAISIKVTDGIVLAVDSASTIIVRDSAGAVIGVSNVYDNANKAFNLYKGLPIGVIVWGAGSIGVHSIGTLIKDFRRILTNGESNGTYDPIDRGRYSLADVATNLKTFLFDDRYLPEYRSNPAAVSKLGLIVAGYSSPSDQPEEYLIEMEGDQCSGPTPLNVNVLAGVTWDGMSEAIHRLLFGFSTQLPIVLENNLGVPHDQIEPAIETLRQALTAQLAIPAMPIKDAIELAEFLAELTIKFVRFQPGPQVVGGPIEVAAITKHEGFKWISRKYYYSRELNPEG